MASCLCMDLFTLLTELSERAGVSPASFLYTFIEDTLENAAEDPEFQADWVEVAEDRGDRSDAVAFFKRVLEPR